jgi:hypothetical protein
MKTAITTAQAIKLARLYLEVATVWEDISSQVDTEAPAIVVQAPIPVPPPLPPLPGKTGRGYWPDAPPAEDIRKAVDKLVGRTGLRVSRLSNISGFAAETLGRWSRGENRIRRSSLAKFNRVLLAYRLDPVLDRNGEVHSV